MSDPIIARFTFKPDRAEEFLEAGRLVTQIESDDIEEIMDYALQFSDALLDANAIVNGQVITLSDYSYEEEEEEV